MYVWRYCCVVSLWSVDAVVGEGVPGKERLGQEDKSGVTSGAWSAIAFLRLLLCWQVGECDGIGERVYIPGADFSLCAVFHLW